MKYEDYLDFLEISPGKRMTISQFLEQHPWAKNNLGFADEGWDEGLFPVLTSKDGTEALCHSEGILYCPPASDDSWSSDPEVMTWWLDEFGIAIYREEK